MQFNCMAAPNRFAAVARALGERVEDASPLEAAARAAAAVRRLADDVDIPMHLSGFGLKQEHVSTVVEEAMKSGNVAVNPRRTTPQELSRILGSIV